jgi:hypothetical protein
VFKRQNILCLFVFVCSCVCVCVCKWVNHSIAQIFVWNPGFNRK